jgi:hypothetical protein
MRSISATTVYGQSWPTGRAFHGPVQSTPARYVKSPARHAARRVVPARKLGKSYFPPNADPIQGSAQGRVPSQLMGRPVEPFFHYFFGFSYFCLFSFLFSFLIE